ncbi:GerAB/ArcD/ProY family transporter [Priestia megaterium]|uniref:GerAB/ArcD/ProY family transporter n=1 Tax=Priestia megaterium TaxID=1404 RepID=UPI0025AF7F7F|nr:GerAB/ArcD/ProY family transporter [Priestia megaterium]MDN3363650.1 GerAB/ArcD/ProY family transporter [Priestia megaterium]WKU25441.1 GerAB/ArcD/ProY family transporter [Priestia megaterium]
MENARISGWQLFVLITLFEIGSAFLVGLAMDAKQDAWIAILVGMISSYALIFIYYRLHRYYPDLALTEYIEKIIGKVPGRVLAFLYVLYFANGAARVLRDFGAMLLTFVYPDTPLFIVNALLMLGIIYTVRQGIEVMARSAELLFFFIYVLAVAGFILIFVSGLLDFSSLKPMLENGISLVLRVAYSQTLYFPFGEVIVFAMIFPHTKNVKKTAFIVFSAITLNGINLMITMIVNIGVLGVTLTSRSAFPLLSTVQSIQFAGFLERLDVFFMVALITGGFFKIGLFFYATVLGLSHVFELKNPSPLVFPVGLVVLFYSLSLAQNYFEHVYEGLKIIPFTLHLPFQIVIPALLLVIAFLRNRKKIQSVPVKNTAENS